MMVARYNNTPAFPKSSSNVTVVTSKYAKRPSSASVASGTSTSRRPSVGVNMPSVPRKASTLKESTLRARDEMSTPAPLTKKASVASMKSVRSTTSSVSKTSSKSSSSSMSSTKSQKKPVKRSADRALRRTPSLVALDNCLELSRLLEKAVEEGDVETVLDCLDVQSLEALKLKSAEERDRFRLDARNSSGQTVLHVAARRGYVEITRILVQYMLREKEDIDALDYHGRTAMGIAAKFGQWSVAIYLAEMGADPLWKDDHGETSITLAMKCGVDDVVRQLKRCARIR
eukprot:GFYU01000066.1.p1 GENE.GFYU01000066.1~~GFYU01000066.1.p1  ORF type:complete len:287 (-),score=55.37 GFYU01000066.1:425-1285(-)